MTTNIKAIDFQMSQKLEEYTTKKLAKIEKLFPQAQTTNVTYTLVKPETNNNKEAQVRINSQLGEILATKTADTFEDALLHCLEALEGQIEKIKEKYK